MSRIVAVTGANGFLASHIIDQLLAAGHHVRATVRNPSDPAKTAHLVALARTHGCPERLALFDADLMRPGSFDSAFAGANAVIHVAMPVVMTAADPHKAIIEPALRGVQNVADSVAKSRDTVTRVVYTSSTECIGSTAAAKASPGCLFSEDEWNDDVTIANAYTYAKVLAERKMVELFSEKDSVLANIPLLCLLPSWIAGPLLNPNGPPPTSLEAFIALTSGEYPFYPDLYVQVVDVRDAAAAHVAALMCTPPTHITRIAVASSVVWSFGDLCRRLRAWYPHMKVATLPAPNFFLYVASLWDSRLSVGFLRDNLGVKHRVDNSRSRTVLGISYRSDELTARASMDSLRELGMIQHRLPKLIIILVAVVAVLALLALVVAR